MLLRKRIYGIENELAVVLQNSDGSWKEVPSGYTKRQCRYVRDNTSVYTYVEPAKLWHTNGACTYVDTGEHPEHATPECFLVKDAVLYAKAGELLMGGIFSKPLSDGSRIVLFKNNLGCDADGSVNINGHFGCHENYLVHGLDLNNQTMMQKIIPFLITRQIMDGAGWWKPDGTFLFSQRSISMESEIERTTTNNRPLITIRETMNDTGSGRLHLILGDANILDVACFLKLGTTSLVLSLLEAGCAPNITYRHPVTTMKIIAKRPDMSTPNNTLIMDGKELSAIDVQVIYHEAARKFYSSHAHECEESRNEMCIVLDLWEQALNALYRLDRKWMIGRFDWATKQYFAERTIKEQHISSSSAIQSTRKTIDILYHNITDRIFQNRMNNQWSDRRLITDRQIEKARYFPPQGTRARMRGLFVASILDIQNKIKSGVGWLACTDNDLPDPINICSTTDPFTESNNQFSSFLLKSLALPHDKILLHHYLDC